jgi:hypothetical protein
MAENGMVASRSATRVCERNLFGLELNLAHRGVKVLVGAVLLAINNGNCAESG